VKIFESIPYAGPAATAKEDENSLQSASPNNISLRIGNMPNQKGLEKATSGLQASTPGATT